MATRTRKTTAKKTTARKPRTTKTTSTPRTGTVVAFRTPLKTRRQTATGPYTTDQLTEARAALASAMAALPIPVLAWTVPTQNTSRRATAHLADDTVITHVADRAPVFTADIPCRHGATHHTTIRTATELTTARLAAANCKVQHATDGWHQAITEGVHTPKVSPLHDGLKKAHAATTDTQPLSTDEIAAHITATATAKEHPQP